jgi:hypothetical protein
VVVLRPAMAASALTRNPSSDNAKTQKRMAFFPDLRVSLNVA